MADGLVLSAFFALPPSFLIPSMTLPFLFSLDDLSPSSSSVSSPSLSAADVVPLPMWNRGGEPERPFAVVSLRTVWLLWVSFLVIVLSTTWSFCLPSSGLSNVVVLANAPTLGGGTYSSSNPV